MLPLGVDMIRQIPIIHISQSDFWARHYEKSGYFTVQLAYRMLSKTKHQRESWLYGETSSLNTEAEEKSWTRLWKAKVPTKLHVFAWWLPLPSLPTGEERNRRHMMDLEICTICNESK